MEWMLATWSSGNPRALVNEPLRRYSAVILSNCLQSVDSQLTVLQNFSFRQMVYIILIQTCQMHPRKQEVHPTFQPVHPTCRIVLKWPAFSTSSRTSYRSRRLFIKSHRSFIPSLLLSKPNPLRWASVWLWVQI